MSIFYAKGRYLVRITDQALGKASTGTPQFALRFLVLGRIVGEEVEEVTEYERTAYFYITDKTAERFTQDLETLGFAGQSFRQLDLSDGNCHDFRGQEAHMWCGEGQNLNGDPKEVWGVARQASQLEVQPLEPKAARELDNLFGKYLKKSNGGTPKSAAPQQASRPIAGANAPDDSDIPF